MRKNRIVSVYMDINPLTGDPFYIGIGTKSRIGVIKRNRVHSDMVKTFPNNNFNRKVIHENIDIETAWEIEKELISKYGKITDKSGILCNIHNGGPLEFDKKQETHWMKGKRFGDFIPHYKNALKGKTYKEYYGEDKSNELIDRIVKNRVSSFTQRTKTYGLSENEKERIVKNS